MTCLTATLLPVEAEGRLPHFFLLLLHNDWIFCLRVVRVGTPKEAWRLAVHHVNGFEVPISSSATKGVWELVQTLLTCVYDETCFGLPTHWSTCRFVLALEVSVESLPDLQKLLLLVLLSTWLNNLCRPWGLPALNIVWAVVGSRRDRQTHGGRLRDGLCEKLRRKMGLWALTLLMMGVGGQSGVKDATHLGGIGLCVFCCFLRWCLYFLLLAQPHLWLL